MIIFVRPFTVTATLDGETAVLDRGTGRVTFTRALSHSPALLAALAVWT